MTPPLPDPSEAGVSKILFQEDHLTAILESRTHEADRMVVYQGLNAHNELHGGNDGAAHCNVIVRDESGTVIAGLLGVTYWGWLAINTMWVDESVRGRGLGERMVRAAEAEAIRRGCHGVHVDTMSFQAPGFYEKLGYVEFGRIEDIPLGQSRIFMKKRLSAMGG
ncbi:MAG: GNAT family N-acetyltransferase [Anaerolineae bacterium]